MEWKDVGSVVGKAAPLLGSILTGNVPGAIMSAGSLIASLFGVENTPQAVQAAIAADPQAAVKLAEIEATNRVELQKLAVQAAANELAHETNRLSIEAGDRDSARNREIQLNDRTPKILAYTVVAGFFGIAFYAIGGYVEGLKDPTTAAMVGGIIGYASAKADQVISYYFGSSSGSKSKTDALSEAIGKMSNVVPFKKAA